MIKNEKARIWVNRIVSMIIAGGLMFLVMNFYVAEKIRGELHDVKYEASGLLNDAKASFKYNNYDKAKETLDILFLKHPNSQEAFEGKKIYAEIESALKSKKELDKEWEIVVPEIRNKWEKMKIVQLREELEAKALKEKDDLENNKDKILNDEWEKAKEEIRKQWEKEKLITSD